MLKLRKLGQCWFSMIAFLLVRVLIGIRHSRLLLWEVDDEGLYVVAKSWQSKLPNCKNSCSFWEAIDHLTAVSLTGGVGELRVLSKGPYHYRQQEHFYCLEIRFERNSWWWNASLQANENRSNEAEDFGLGRSALSKKRSVEHKTTKRSKRVCWQDRAKDSDQRVGGWRWTTRRPSSVMQM